MRPPPSWSTKYLTQNLYVVKKFTAPIRLTDHRNVAYMDATLFTDHEQFGVPVDMAKHIVSQHVAIA